MVDTNHKIAFCIDSDGCAMDTMTYKHQLFFGPIAADIFGISEQERTSFLKEWDRVNLYSRTRGVNRFVGLVMGLEFAGVEHIDKLKEWVETTDSLSNNSLELALANDFSRDLEKALEWSNEVNRQIKNYEGDSLAFSGVLESLERLSQFGNVYVVSSANKEAVWQEWEEQGLLKHVDDIYCQDRGKKEDVIATLIASGYCRETILMVGDSLGDLAAAEQNGIAFYPVLVGKEVKSWEILREDIGEAFAKGQFEQQRQKESINTFWANLDN
ncbi:TPA: HAD family hydrolase [Streptococcus agalactiae]